MPPCYSLPIPQAEDVGMDRPLVTRPFRVGIVGGGVAGSTLAEYLSRVDGVSVTLIEKNKLLVSNTPFCHLHAGGLLYALNIPESEARSLLYHSLRFASWFPQCLAKRPTVVGLRRECTDDPNIVVRRCEVAKEEYERLVGEGMSPVLGNSSDYYKAYSRAELEALRSRPAVDSSMAGHDDYVATFARMTDLDTIQYPVVCVNEPGVAMVRVGAALELALADRAVERGPRGLTVLKETSVGSVVRTPAGQYAVTTSGVHGPLHFTFDYLVNATGGNSPAFDALVPGCPAVPSLAELKSSYVVDMRNGPELYTAEPNMPELALLGTRGSPNGMVQVTPYGGGYYQLHAMTPDATLFPGGLAKCDPVAAFPADLQPIVDNGFDPVTLETRSLASARHAAKICPDLAKAQSANIPLWGVQLIAGSDAERRSGEAEFPLEGYAKLVIVKGISAVAAAEVVLGDILDSAAPHVPREAIVKQMKREAPVSLEGSRLVEHAVHVARQRNMPDVFGTVGWEGKVEV
eukprot:comp5357_c0_seq1/m.1335 comp5357_c0_seq1/g.1335  ORF comp5357_c0_seq1/g.1335 comp5357_c0_seq1/m.1335 type:complete len:518 (-) comp5357_c0_seq1:326-1879(-)